MNTSHLCKAISSSDNILKEPLSWIIRLSTRTYVHTQVLAKETANPLVNLWSQEFFEHKLKPHVKVR